uniref:Uncharacterized protein n=1 Tax=Anguilla anguilla TaxID=7936 RepID=A0A0E9SWS5_ANGAN
MLGRHVASCLCTTAPILETELHLHNWSQMGSLLLMETGHCYTNYLNWNNEVLQ